MWLEGFCKDSPYGPIVSIPGQEGFADSQSQPAHIPAGFL